jgi:hypothetical protein
MLEDRDGDAKRHIGACRVNPVLSFAKKKNGPESLGAVDGSQLRLLAQLEVQLQAELHDTRVAG